MSTQEVIEKSHEEDAWKHYRDGNQIIPYSEAFFAGFCMTLSPYQSFVKAKTPSNDFRNNAKLKGFISRKKPILAILNYIIELCIRDVSLFLNNLEKHVVDA